ncbi:MFS transporter [Geopsychrobacter electrodiphilus]|uniref:MFS transporter n=1 Tax=Geopsychrobacter electrodiphilus TaxID=225196 RepID=UPI0003633332|nr:MFS transporter [Geopsychrobacter electrodiphilus]
MKLPTLCNRKTISYALYDWGNSAFATTIMAGFFPVFFKQFWSAGSDVTLSTARLGFGNAAAGLFLALLAPILGAISDRGIHKKHFLLFFTLIGALFSASLFFVGQGDWQLAVIIYIAGTICFIGSNLFYDSLLVDVAAPEQRNMVSAFAYSAGYLGGGLLFALNVAMTLRPGFFGLDGPAQAIRISFLSVGIWWCVFGLPIQFAGIRSRTSAPLNLRLFSAAFKQLAGTFREIRAYRSILLFLIAYWFYIDGVNTIIKMAVDYGLSLGFHSSALITALLITQFVGFPAALFFGWLAKRIGPIRAIRIAIIVYLGVTISAAFMRTELEFYLMAISIGLVQGGIQALSRATFANMIPEDKSAEFFGFYNMVGKFAAIIGPALIAITGLLAHKAGLAETVATRVGISSIAIMFIAGWFFLGLATGQNPSQEEEHS